MPDSESFLDEFLKHQLLDIGDDDGRLANLQAAADTVCNMLMADLSQLARYTRVGLDKDIDPDEPVLEEIEAAITAQWKLMRNKHTERPVSIIRAVLWESVRNAVDADNNAAVVALTAKAESDDANLGPEADICQRFLGEVVTRVERIAETEWTGPPQLGTKTEKRKPTPINIELLEQKLIAACGPNGSEGAIEGANPQWPAANETWSAEFSQRAAKGIAEVVEKRVKSAQTTLDAVAQDLATEIQNARLAVSRKTDLLWWSQSQYSVTLHAGFSEIPAAALPFFLAADVQLLAPGLCPQSVEHYLAHVVHTVAPRSKKINVRKMIEVLLTSELKVTVAQTVHNVPDTAGRCGILSAVKRSLADPTSLDNVERYIALGTKEITLPVLAKRIFWELKATNIASSPESGDASE